MSGSAWRDPPQRSHPVTVRTAVSATCACRHPLHAHFDGVTGRGCGACQAAWGLCQTFVLSNRKARRGAKYDQ